jgi:nickel-dependent lactate racemase
MATVTVPNLLWYGNKPRELRFPSRWGLEVLEPPGFKKEASGKGAISTAFDNPIGSPALEDLAKDANEAVIVFDDITRPTPVSHILPWVMEALDKGGVPRNNIRFIPALGLHGAMNNIDFRKKLGEHIVGNYAIYNHNPYENCEYIGETANGTPVHINREFMSCDLRIGIGCIAPHVHAGFGGGGKIVFPGVSGIESVHTFHSKVFQSDAHTTGLGRFENNVMYKEIVEAVRMSGLQIIINAIINKRGEITDLFVGDPVLAHKAGVEVAKEHYATAPRPGKDIVIANAYGKYNEMAICMFLAMQTVNINRGVIVLLVDSPEGQICHYLFRSFGKDYGGRMYGGKGKRSAPVAPDTVKVVVCTEYPDRTMCDFFASPDEVIIKHNWEETLALLEKEYPKEASVGVIPDGTMQYFVTV